MVKACIRYFLYILNHKVNVLIECWKEGLYIQGIVHDLSKFTPTEFFPYAKKFYSGKPLNIDEELKWKYAWLSHQRKNKHHWEYWVVNPKTQEALPMPKKYVIEMICDWRSFSRKWGKKVKNTNLKITDSMVVHPDTKKEIELMIFHRPNDKSSANGEG